VGAPVAVVAAAIALGLLAFGPVKDVAPTASVSQPGALPGSVLADATTASSTSRSSQVALGRTLFEENCSSCHGTSAEGSALAPNLRGVGAATVDLWVSSGWMPLTNPGAQPLPKPAKFDKAQTVAIANFVETLGGGPKIPKVDLAGASVSEGLSVFALNCAPCHTITGAGDALSNGISAPSLHSVTKTMIMEAVRTGPGNMPRFGPGTISTAQVHDVIAYVTRYIEHPRDPGGLGLGGVGPVAEGFVGLFVGVGLCVLAAFWIGDRTPRDLEEDGADGHGGASDQGSAHA